MGKKLTEKDIDIIVDLYVKGIEANKIATVLQVDVSTVYKKLNIRGVKHHCPQNVQYTRECRAKKAAKAKQDKTEDDPVADMAEQINRKALVMKLLLSLSEQEKLEVAAEILVDVI